MRRNSTERAKLGNSASAVTIALALLLATLPPSGVTAQPRTLTASEMDRVTAGRIRVDAIAFAQASGNFALAQTRSDALVITINERALGVGLAEGLAFACCSPQSAVSVRSSVNSTAEIVQSKTAAATFRGAIVSRDDQVRHFAYGYTATFLVAMSPGDQPDAGAQTVQAPWDLGELLNGLIDLGQSKGRDGVVSGFEFAPVFMAGIRQRLFQDFRAAMLPKSIRPTRSLPSSSLRFL